ncbi:hypothetical protein VPH35_049262 [Triticum aestivum]
MYYQEKAEHEKTSSNKASSIGQVGRIVKMGPCGGGRGIVRDIDPCNFRRILKMVVWHGGAVSGVLGLYDLDDQEGEELIGREGKRSEICLESDEYLIGAKGHVGDYNGRFVVRSLSFIGNRRTFGPYGTEEGTPFELPAVGGEIVGLHGRSEYVIDAFGTYVRMDA